MQEVVGMFRINPQEQAQGFRYAVFRACPLRRGMPRKQKTPGARPRVQVAGKGL